MAWTASERSTVGDRPALPFFPGILSLPLSIQPALRRDHLLGAVGRWPHEGLYVLIVDDFLLQQGICQLGQKGSVSMQSPDKSALSAGMKSLAA